MEKWPSHIFPEIMKPVSSVTVSLDSDICLHFSHNWLGIGINFQAKGLRPLQKCRELKVNVCPRTANIEREHKSPHIKVTGGGTQSSLV